MKTYKKITGWTLLISLMLIGFLTNLVEPKKVYKLHLGKTRSGRAIVYLEDQNGSIQIVDGKDIELIEKLKLEYEIVEE